MELRRTDAPDHALARVGVSPIETRKAGHVTPPRPRRSRQADCSERVSWHPRPLRLEPTPRGTVRMLVDHTSSHHHRWPMACGAP
eukprot:764235-Prymnesium_polylepis.3